jgi:UDP-N-acetyl-D-mannosaminuronate dehydrogenase
VRGKHIKMVEDLYHYVKFVAGTNSVAVERVQQQLSAAGVKSESMPTPETLELAKLLETSYFGVLIAWAQEMNRLSAKVGADYLQVTRFFREVGYLPPVVFQPGFIGGHCVMPNITLLKQKIESPFLDTIVASNELRRAELELEDSSEQLKSRMAFLNQN